MDGDARADLRVDRFDAVVFDLDGVVTDTARVHEAAWRDLFDAFLAEHQRAGGVGDTTPFSPEDYRRHVDGKARADGVAAFLAARGIALPLGEPSDPPGAPTVWGIGNRKDLLFRRRLSDEGIDVFPDAVALIDALRAAAIPIAIVSASRNCRRVLEVAGLATAFDTRVDGLDAAALGLPGKPDPAIFLEATRRLGVGAAGAALVEDAIVGVEAGRRGRFGLVVGVDRSGARRDELLAAGATVVVSDLTSLLAGAAAAGGRSPLGRPPTPP